MKAAPQQCTELKPLPGDAGPALRAARTFRTHSDRLPCLSSDHEDDLAAAERLAARDQRLGHAALHHDGAPSPTGAGSALLRPHCRRHRPSVFRKVLLGLSFGVVAANRGVKIGGPYSFIRHPMYAGYRDYSQAVRYRLIPWIY